MATGEHVSSCEGVVLGDDLAPYPALNQLPVRLPHETLVNRARAVAVMRLAIPCLRRGGQPASRPLGLFFLEPIYRLFLALRQAGRPAPAYRHLGAYGTSFLVKETPQ